MNVCMYAFVTNNFHVIVCNSRVIGDSAYVKNKYGYCYFCFFLYTFFFSLAYVDVKHFCNFKKVKLQFVVFNIQTYTV